MNTIKNQLLEIITQFMPDLNTKEVSYKWMFIFLMKKMVLHTLIHT